VRSELRVPHPGQRVSGAPSGHQVLPKGQRAGRVCEADPGAHQAANPARAQAAVRHPEGLRRVMRQVVPAPYTTT